MFRYFIRSQILKEISYLKFNSFCIEFNRKKNIKLDYLFWNDIIW